MSVRTCRLEDGSGRTCALLLQQRACSRSMCISSHPTPKPSRANSTKNRGHTITHEHTNTPTQTRERAASAHERTEDKPVRNIVPRKVVHTSPNSHRDRLTDGCSAPSLPLVTSRRAQPASRCHTALLTLRVYRVSLWNPRSRGRTTTPAPEGAGLQHDRTASSLGPLSSQR